MQKTVAHVPQHPNCHLRDLKHPQKLDERVGRFGAPTQPGGHEHL